MPGAVRRMTVPLVVAAAVALVTALPAFAKGEDTRPVRITASVTGPGLAVPVVITWRGDCPFPEYCGLDVGRSGNQLDAYSFLNGAGILGRPVTGPPPPAEALGPRYEVTYRAVSRGVVMTAHQDLYPFGPSTSHYDPQRPWIYTLPGQRLFTAMVPGGWILAPTSLVSILRDHGFTVPAPPMSARTTAPKTAGPAALAEPDGPAPWALALGALALAAMVAVGAAVGKARSGRRPPDPAVTN